MAIRNLLVAYNEVQSSQNALQAALMMQRKYDTHLTGLLVHYGERDRFVGENWVPDDLRERIETGVHAREEAVELMFRRQAESQVPQEKLHWTAMSGSPDETVAKHSVMYDVTIVGQHTASADGAVDLHPERIATNSARPVLVVPAEYDPDTINRPAVIAWDGRKAATRVLHDAVQMLETKSQVHVISIGEAVFRPDNCIDVETSLGRHGVKVTRHHLKPQSRRVADDILGFCGEVNAGTLVMGADDKGLFRQELFGGTARYILEHTGIPVLVSS